MRDTATQPAPKGGPGTLRDWVHTLLAQEKAEDSLSLLLEAGAQQGRRGMLRHGVDTAPQQMPATWAPQKQGIFHTQTTA